MNAWTQTTIKERDKKAHPDQTDNKQRPTTTMNLTADRWQFRVKPICNSTRRRQQCLVFL